MCENTFTDFQLLLDFVSSVSQIVQTFPYIDISTFRRMASRWKYTEFILVTHKMNLNFIYSNKRPPTNNFTLLYSVRTFVR